MTTALALAGALVAAVACEQVLSIDGTVTVAPASACGLSLAAGACQSCVASSCCSQATACAADTACAAFETCILGCGSDYACRSQCNLDHLPGNDAVVPAFDACVTTACNDACGTQCGLTASPSAPDAAVPCSQCITSKVCSPVQKCASSATCEEVEHCIAGCRTVDCHDTCLAADDAGLFSSLEVALITACLPQCQFGNEWSCVGSVSWPLAPAGANEVDFTVLQSGPGTPVANATVKACSKTDQYCSTVITSATSDAKGRGTLTLPSHQAVQLGFDGYYDIENAAQGEMPWLVFASSPLTMLKVDFTWSVLSSKDLDTLLAGIGLTRTSGLGHVAVGVVDCLLSNSSDVVVNAITESGQDLSAQRYYLAGGALSKNVKSTDITGFAFFFNVPPGNVTITAVPNATGKPSSTQVLSVRPDAVSSVIALPTPL